MAVRDPAEMPATFGRLFNARDGAGLAALYEPGALLTIDGEQVASGLGQIGPMMRPLMESPLTLTIRCGLCHVAGDLALVQSLWRLTGPDGAEALSGASAEVLRRGADGLWRFVIDDATFASRARA
jgi:ketosteroid isomerase-like protein